MSTITPVQVTEVRNKKLRGGLFAGDRRLAYLLLLPGAILLTLLAVIPFGHVLFISLLDMETGESSGNFVGLANYAWALNSTDFHSALSKSLIWTFGSVAAEMLLGLGVAVLMNQRFYLRGLARALVLFPYLVPTIVAVLVWRYMFNDMVGVVNYFLISLGLTDSPLLWLSSSDWSMFAVILVGTWKFFPFVVIALLGILQAIPQDQFEAAEIDGASKWQQFWYITMPSILPVFVITALLRTIWNFDKFDIIYLLTGGGPMNSTTTLPLMTYFKAFTDLQMGRAAAVAVLSFVFLGIILVVYLKLQGKAEEKIS